MTTTHCWAVVKPSVVLMASSSAPPLKQVMNYSYSHISSWGSACKWLSSLSEAFLWHYVGARYQGDTCCSGWCSISCVNTYHCIDILYRKNAHQWTLPPLVVLVCCDEASLPRLSTAEGRSQHLSLTVMKQPFNARRQPTCVESSLSQGVEVALSYS